MGLKANEQKEEQAPGEGSNRAARLGFIILVQAHYWQGQSTCGEATLRNFTAEERGIKRQPGGRLDGINRGRLDERQGSRFAGLSDGPSHGIQQHWATPRDFSNPAGTSPIPQATATTAAAGRALRHPEPDATAPAVPPKGLGTRGDVSQPWPPSTASSHRCRPTGAGSVTAAMSPTPGQAAGTPVLSSWNTITRDRLREEPVATAEASPGTLQGDGDQALK
jgi:hypothetical protein